MKIKPYIFNHFLSVFNSLLYVYVYGFQQQIFDEYFLSFWLTFQRFIFSHVIEEILNIFHFLDFFIFYRVVFFSQDPFVVFISHVVGRESERFFLFLLNLRLPFSNVYFPQEITDHFCFHFSRLPEHKNMPLEDALGLINRDFSRYCQAVREGHMRQQSKRPDPAPGGSGNLTIEQISSVIDNLQQKKNELMKKQGTNFSHYLRA